MLLRHGVENRVYGVENGVAQLGEIVTVHALAGGLGHVGENHRIRRCVHLLLDGTTVLDDAECIF